MSKKSKPADLTDDDLEKVEGGSRISYSSIKPKMSKTQLARDTSARLPGVRVPGLRDLPDFD